MMNCTKWLQIPTEKYNDYDVNIKICNICNNYIYYYFIHYEFGDYTCFECEESGNIKLLCIYCKNKKQK
jgi:hypothetical protein